MTSKPKDGIRIDPGFCLKGREKRAAAELLFVF